MAKDYGVDSIQRQSELEAVRMYPNVYLGSDDLAGATQTIYEILANSVDEANSGFGNKIDVIIHKDNSVTIKDRGRGVPMDLNKKTGQYTYESVFCKLHAGGKLKGSRNNYNASAGQHGIGATATNFSAKWFKVESRRDGYIFKVAFNEGVLDGKFEKTKDTKTPQKTGTTISWKPDEKVFTSIDFDIEELRYWIKSQAICSDNVEFVLKDERNSVNESYKYENGILSYAQEILGEEEKLSDITLFEASGAGKDKADRPNYTVNAKVAFAFTNKTNHYSFYHNSIPLPTGGAPKRAMQRAFSEYFKGELKKNNPTAAKEIEFDDVAESLVCVISTTTKEPPSFENQTKKSISNKFIEDFLTLQITKHLKDWAKDNPMELEKVTNQVAINIQSRKSASAQKLATKQKLTNKIKLDDRIKNFVDCRNKEPKDRELFIAEGLSAMGSLKQARNGESQALLAIRGKILNTLKSDYSTIFKNELIMDIMKLVGTGVEMKGGKGKNNLGNFDIENRRFDKIIIATDQDIDGCFTGDTKIKSLDGNTYTFEELVNNNIQELWVYSKDEAGNVVPAKAINPRVTKETTELVELTFENGFTVRCTPDHRILLNNGTYKEAKDLTPDDSISSIYFRLSQPKNYLQFSAQGCDWKWVHQEVNDYLNTPTRQELLNNITKENYHNFRGGEVVVHHKNHNKYDNRPENLVAMYNKEHGRLHFVEYNKSDEKQQKLKKKRENKEYDDWYKSRITRGLVEFNKSEKHRKQVSEMNKNPDMIILQKLGSCAGIISYLNQHNIDINENNYNDFIKRNHQGLPRWDKMLNYLSNVNITLNDFIEMSKSHAPNKGEEKDTNTIGKFKKQIANIISKLDTYDEQSYVSKRNELNSRAPKWETILKYFNSYDEAYNFSKLYNHKISSIKHINLDMPVKVYDLTVPGYENFMICVDDENMEGIIVHNCHIVALCLTLFYRLTPELIKQGYVYFLDTPLYEIQVLEGKDKGKMLYAFTDQEMNDMTKGIKCKVSRNKGLGEVDYQTMSIFMAPETRHLTRVTMDDVKEAEKNLELFMGSDSSDRKEYITAHGKEYTDLDLE